MVPWSSAQTTTVTHVDLQTPPITTYETTRSTSCRSAQRCPSSRSMREIQPSLEEVSGPKNHEMTENQPNNETPNVTYVGQNYKNQNKRMRQSCQAFWDWQWVTWIKKEKPAHQGTHACMIYTYFTSISFIYIYIYIHSLLCASNINLSFSLNSYPVRLVDLQCDRESWAEAQSLGPKLPAKIGDDGAVILLLYHPIVFSLNQQHPLLMHNF